MSKILVSISIYLCMVCHSGAWAVVASSGEVLDSYLDIFVQEPVQNGISPKEVGKFWEEWHLVTSRYRKDSDQIRFVYANEIAWKALKEKKKKFPGGSMFAKIAYSSSPDPTFPSSLMPESLHRIQMMKKDDKLYSSTNGWGYAVFIPKGVGRNQERELPVVCHACHKIVSHSDYIFATSVFGKAPITKEPSRYQTKFISEKWSTLSLRERSAVGFLSQTSINSIKVYRMPVFIGSLMESIGSMAEFSLEKRMVHLLTDQPATKFLAVAPGKPGADCKAVAQFVMKSGPAFSRVLKTGKVCDGKIIYDKSTMLWSIDKLQK